MEDKMDITTLTTDHETNDFKLTPDGRELDMSKDAKSVVQEIENELQLIKGELDDENRGVDYYGIIFSNTPINMKVAEFVRVIQMNPYVKEVTMTKFTKDPKTGTAHFSFTMNSIFGDLEVIQDVEM
jgi:hypothetical protein